MNDTGNASETTGDTEGTQTAADAMSADQAQQAIEELAATQADEGENGDSDLFVVTDDPEEAVAAMGEPRQVWTD